MFECVWDSSGSAVLKLNGIACVLLRMAVDSSKKSEAQPSNLHSMPHSTHSIAVNIGLVHFAGADAPWYYRYSHARPIGREEQLALDSHYLGLTEGLENSPLLPSLSLRFPSTDDELPLNVACCHTRCCTDA